MHLTLSYLLITALTLTTTSLASAFQSYNPNGPVAAPSNPANAPAPAPPTPACITECTTPIINNPAILGCQPLDFNCICNSPNFVNAVRDCSHQHCPPANQHDADMLVPSMAIMCKLYADASLVVLVGRGSVGLSGWACLVGLSRWMKKLLVNILFYLYSFFVVFA